MKEVAKIYEVKKINCLSNERIFFNCKNVLKNRKSKNEQDLVNFIKNVNEQIFIKKFYQLFLQYGRIHS